MLLADVLVAASELPSSSTVPGGKAGLQTAYDAARPAASSADDAWPKGSTPPGSPKCAFAIQWCRLMSRLTQLSSQARTTSCTWH